MKKLVLIICLSGFFSFTANALEKIDNEKEQRTLSVSGDATVLVAPDQVVISLTAEKRGLNVLEIHKKNDESVKALKTFLTQEKKVKSEHIQTNYITVQPVYKKCGFELIRLGKCDSEQIEYYSLSRTMKIILDDPTAFESVIFKCLELGLSRIDSVEFLSTDFRKYRDQARGMAMKAAQEKALSLAEPLGMKVLKPLEIKAEDSSTSPSWNKLYVVAFNVRTEDEDPSELGPKIQSEGFGQINITASVQVTFEIE
ncbi:MAG: SIMPL domain-containing protein [Alphaproteobacteria bacterium]|nr:SIMPL domain-containing protein [Alphaproteobacteria bacterium]QQS57928.1 MAG: SIMPL domain-containing protein [Alphaproteobacteria bacterium]